MNVEVKQFPRVDPRLDWVSMHDERSRAFPARAAIGEPVPEKVQSWRAGPVLNQYAEGACVGFGWTAELIASPRPDRFVSAEGADQYALGLYREARRIDEWEGEDYDGTSVLAGAKVVTARGLIAGYRWCFSIDEVRQAVISLGPVVIGIPWYARMYETRPSGLVEVGGDLVGGHCLTLTGYHPGMRIRGEQGLPRVFRWRNSWGTEYGFRGNGFVRYEDLRDLLADHGEACAPITRRKVRLTGNGSATVRGSVGGNRPIST